MTDYRRKVLIVDDSKTFQQVLKASLNQYQWEAFFCNDGKTALDLISDHCIDFICSSYHLRDMEGVELCQQIRLLTTTNMPFVLLTSVDSEDMLRKALPAGVTEVFHKNDIQQLLAFIKRFPSFHSPIRGRVLYVEDSISQQAHLKSILESRGLSVDAFASAEAAWRSFIEYEYDIVLTDIVLDGSMSGLAFVNQIRRTPSEKGDVPILAVTAFDDKMRRIQLFNLGVTDYILKPVAEEELFVRIDSLVTTRTERKQAEQELRVAAIAFESQDGIIVTDQHGVIVRVNQAFARLTGYNTEELVGQKPSVFRSGRYDQSFYQRMWAELTQKRGWQGEIWNRRKNGTVYAEWLAISAVSAPDGSISHYVGSYSDITKLHGEAEAKIHRLAYYDPLTQLPNRRLLMDRLGQALAVSYRTGHYGALIFLDLDDFKSLNDTLGHVTGDLLLQQVAQRLTSCLREGDTAARMGGDEFVIMLENLNEQDMEAATQAEVIGNKILAVLNLPYQLDGIKQYSSPSAGITLFKAHQAGIDELLKQAEIAMYQAKKAGRNALCFFDPQMQANISARVALETDLRQALAENQFELFYQLQTTHARQAVGAEALIRWRHPEHGLIPPTHFIPLAEETGLIVPIGLWVLHTACTLLKQWELKPETQDLQLAVNVSARQFFQDDFVAQVSQALHSSGIKPDRLKLELTESLVLDDINDTINKMQALRNIGVRFSMDDFGTGHSSLASLKKLPLDQLKIDQSFVRDIPIDQDDAIIVQTIIVMAKNLGMEVIAEGVETEDQRAFLEQHGCLVCQGYLFSKPIPLAEFERMLGG